MSNLQLRIISAVILVAIVLPLTWFGGLPFQLLAALIGALVFYEWTTITGAGRDRPLLIAGWVLVAAVLGAMVLGFDGGATAGGALAATAALLILGLVRGGRFEVGKGAAYALVPALALAALRGADMAGLWTIIYLFAVVWATDIFAYFVGRAIGGPKLAPSISPGKTWSGAVGGTICAILAAVIVALAHGGASSVLLGAVALPLSILSQLGDLYESRLKRRVGVKDSSNLIPGHGGVMDRVDGLVAAAAGLYLGGLAILSHTGVSAALFGG